MVAGAKWVVVVCMRVSARSSLASMAAPSSSPIMRMMPASPEFGLPKLIMSLLPWPSLPQKQGVQPKYGNSEWVWAVVMASRSMGWVMGGACWAASRLSAVGRHRTMAGCRDLSVSIQAHTRLPSLTGSPRARRLKLRRHFIVMSFLLFLHVAMSPCSPSGSGDH